jgi:hypothetical protein
MPALPTPLRAVLGLAATIADEARHLPDRAIELPMLAVSTALQLSLRAQQHYARLAARGDDLLAGRAGDEPPDWATFDAPVTAAGNGATPPRRGTRGTRTGTGPAKTVRPPRSGKPSAFDAVDDD